MGWTLSPATRERIDQVSAAITAAADAQAQKFLDQAAAAFSDNRPSAARESLGQAQAMGWTLSPSMVERIAKERGALAAASKTDKGDDMDAVEARMRRVFDQVKTAARADNFARARQLLGQAEETKWAASTAGAKAIEEVRALIVAEADGQVRPMLDRATAATKDGDLPLAWQSLGATDALTWTVSPTVARAVEQTRADLLRWADGQARTILDGASAAVKEKNFSSARQALARAEAMAWTISPAMVKSIDESRGALRAAEQRAAG
jgi:hypothetical protein